MSKVFNLNTMIYSLPFRRNILLYSLSSRIIAYPSFICYCVMSYPVEDEIKPNIFLDFVV